MFPRLKSPIPRAGAAAVLALVVSRAAHVARGDTPPASINIAGSTAFSAFFSSPGSTNDYVDVNNDGTFGFNINGTSDPNGIPFVQQLAAPITLSGNTLTGYATSSNNSGASVVAHWSVQYSGVGSVNGLIELVNSGTGNVPPTTVGNPSFINGTTAVTSAGTPQFGTTGPADFPIGTPYNNVDIAVMDVNVSWGVQGNTGAAAWNLKPTQAGYGTNPANPVGATTQTNQLATLSTSAGTLNLNTAAPNSKTVFGTALAFAPISVVSNHGTGIQNVTQTQLQTLYVTGRMPNGENLVTATRDIGSGTRNGIMNSIGVDPSFGIGENIGNITTNDGVQTALGAQFQPTNLDATGAMASVVTNDRLAIGYVSTTTGKSAQDTGAYETLGVTFNLEGGTAPVRPTAASLIDNAAPNSGYRIGGTETMATVGDPLATSVNSTYSALTSNPQMANTAAADYIRNIYESVQGFVANPGADSNTFMPAQSLLANTFIPLAALQDQQNALDGTDWVANNASSNAANSAVAALTNLNTAAYGTGAKAFGVVPTRESGLTYSDGQTTSSYRFYDSTGALQQLSANVALNARNAIEGNFSAADTSTCNIGDIPQMMAAVANPAAWAMANNSGTVGSALGNAAVPEILGDFNGDGNFNVNDVRYFADGLALRTTGPHAGQLDRKAGFTAVDTNWTVSTAGHPVGNYFNTTLATNKTYAAGDSRGDIAGSVQGPSAGGAPTGADGKVDAKDIDYEILQIKGATGQLSVQPVTPGTVTEGSFATMLANATTITPAPINVRADLSADMNGDLDINKNDLDELVQNVLGTQYGDVNLDGKVDGNDLSIVLAHFNQSGWGWAGGDFLGTPTIDGNELSLVLANFNFGVTTPTVITAAEWTQIGIDLAASPVPEPASMALLSAGALLLFRRGRRARARSI